MNTIKSFARRLRAFLFKGKRSPAEKFFYAQTLAQVQSFNLPDAAANIPLHIFTVTYNNALLLDHQERLIRKNITDKHVFIVADNSPDPEKRKRIAQKCREKNIGYIGLPPNPYHLNSSSHGICLNWLCRHYMPLYQPKAFGFIDHDIYPVQPVSVLGYLKDQPVYGHWQGQIQNWYLWAGLCFFNYQALKHKTFNFLPTAIGARQLDTGGSNWKEIYSEMDMNALKFPSHQYISLREGDVIQSDKMEQIGEWLHSFNGSYWMKTEPKENLLNAYLDKL